MVSKRTPDLVILEGVDIIVSGRFVRTARINDEWYLDVTNPDSVIDMLRETTSIRADIFTFWQRLPDTIRKYEYYSEDESIAAVPVSTFDHWWKKQVDPTVRNKIRKSQKAGVEVKRSNFDDDFIMGITKIFNESPVRQGRPFWHYGKTFATVKREFSKNLFREEIVGAYYHGELIGFLMLADAGKYADITQILSSLNHRDKSPMNALLAEAVRACEARGLPHLVYARWLTGSLGEFKRHNGFERIDLPRYYVPLNATGRLALRMRLHHGLKGLLPDKVRAFSKTLRERWYARRPFTPTPA